MTRSDPPARQGEPRRSMTRGEWMALAGALALALAVRLIYLRQIRDNPLFASLLGDPAVYMAQAGDIANGKIVPDHAYFHSSPLYPFFLVLVSRLGGTGLQAVRIVQSVVGTASVALVFLLGRLTLGRRSGLVAAFLAAVYVPFIFFEAEFLEITLVIAFVLGSLVMLELADRTGGPVRTLLAGMLLGLAGLGKPNLLLFAPAGALWLARARWLRAAGPGKGRGEGKPSARAAGSNRWLLAALFFVAAGAVVLPATIHNFRAEGDLIPVSSNGGINFYIGNHWRSPGVFQVPPEMRFDLRVASKQAAERELGKKLSAGEVSSFWMRKAWREIRANPGSWIALMGRKFALFWNHYEVPNHYHLYFVRESASVLRIPVGTFGVVAPLGLFGIGLALLRRKRVGLLVLFGLTFMASVLPFFITGRYRLAIVPVLLVGAGFAVVSLTRALLERRWKMIALSAVAIGLVAVGVGVNMIEFSFAPMYNAVGTILGERGEFKDAALQFERALEIKPTDLSSRYNLGLALLELGRFDEAAEHFKRAVELDPRYYEAWIGLGKARAGAGRFEEARRAFLEVTGMEPPAPASLREEAQRLLGKLEARQDERGSEGDR